MRVTRTATTKQTAYRHLRSRNSNKDKILIPTTTLATAFFLHKIEIMNKNPTTTTEVPFKEIKTAKKRQSIATEAKIKTSRHWMRLSSPNLILTNQRRGKNQSAV
jgi:hypothetical protein